MFTLRNSQLVEFNIQKAKEFIDFWSKYYHYNVKILYSNTLIDYNKELNIGNKLTEQNVKRLLRWKDYLRLTEIILSGQRMGQKNVKVAKVIKKLQIINDFRYGGITEDQFKKVIKNIFPNGFVWRIFLFHIARPFTYPIADQNVFRAYSTQTKKEISNNWDNYNDYINYFFKICISADIIKIRPNGNEANIKEIVSKLKIVDNAIFAFGQFLKVYREEYNK